MVTYDGPVTIHLNGEDLHLIPIRSAHTDVDTLVGFPGHDILAVGTTFAAQAIPMSISTTADRSQDCSPGLARPLGARARRPGSFQGMVPSPTTRVAPVAVCTTKQG